MVQASRLECADDETAAPLEDVAGLARRRVPARARLSSLGRAQDGRATAGTASAGVPAGAADADDLRRHAGGDPRTAAPARPATTQRTSPGQPVGSSEAKT